MDSLIFLAVILLLGTLSSLLALKLKVSNIFFLIFIGMLFGIFGFSFPREGILTIATVALVVIIFNNTARFKFVEIIKYSQKSIKMALLFFVINLVFLSLVIFYLFNLKSVALALFFASLVYGIDPTITLAVLKKSKNKIVKILQIESIINNPLTIIIPLAILNFLSKQEASPYVEASQQIMPFIQQFIVAIGVGVTFGLGIVWFMKKFEIGKLNFLVIITSSIVSYVLAEALQGSGILAVTLFGLIFGNYHLKKKESLQKFVDIFSDSLEIVVFILIGTIILIPADFSFVLKGTMLFLFYILLRFLAVQLANHTFTLKEKIFMSLNVPKGIDVGIVILLMISGAYTNINKIGLILNLCLLFILYSIVLSTITTRFTSFFIKNDQ